VGRVAIGAAALVGAAALAAGLYLGAGGRTTAPSTADLRALTSQQFADSKGAFRTLEDFRGQLVVVNFWATWCVPCREEIPTLIDIYERYASKGVVIVGISIDAPDKVMLFAQQLGMPYPLLLGDAGTIDLMKRVGNTLGALPYTLVLDRSGAVVDRHLGIVRPAELEAKLTQLLS
jgi:thiol-disulfide isomerase/thioredoxin